MITPKHLIIIFTLFIFSNCNNENTSNSNLDNNVSTSKEQVANSTLTENKINLSIDSSYNNLAYLIGGYPTKCYQPESNRTFIENYNNNINYKMTNIEIQRLSKIKKWNEANLKSNSANDSNYVFYPFSGGDFIHMAWLYPNASDYFMIAREAVGDIPNLFAKDTSFTNQYLRDIEFVLRDIYNKSYFITKNMDADTKHTTKVNGMLPLILWGAVRTGHDINQVRFGKIDEKGDFIPVSNHGKSTVVQIKLWNKKLRKQQNVTYFCCDLANDELSKNSGNLTYINQSVKSGCNTFIKSASYLMHYTKFTTIKDLTLQKTDYLVQDDTGIPYNQFKKDQWTINLYGIYEKPVRDFIDNLYQQDLDSAYKTSSFKGSLDFSLGYHWGSKKQNQIIAKKNLN